MGLSLFSLRFFNALLGIATALIIYFICNKFYSRKEALVATFFYLILPLSVFLNKIAVVDNGLTLFTTVMMAFFLLYYKDGKLRYLLLSAAFAGMAFLIKFTAFQFVAVLLIVMILSKRFRDSLLFILLTVFFPTVFAIILWSGGLLDFFIQQTIYVQFFNSAFAHTVMEKIYMCAYYLFWVLPFFVLAMIAIKNSKKTEDHILGLWYLVPLVLILVGTHVFLQYFMPLTPPLCILSAIAILKYRLPTKDWLRQPLHLFNISKVLLTFVIIALLISPILFSLSYSFGSVSESDIQKTKILIGNYVASITKPDGKIWTTDASIAFFARRVIVSVESRYYKYQGFFEGSFGYAMDGTYRGPFGPGIPTLISLQEILLALEKYKPEVIIVNKDLLVDKLIWYGIYNPYYSEDGLSSYIVENYYLSKKFSEGDVEVWVKKR